MLRDLYVEPLLEANEPPGIVWRLQRAVYGTLDATAAWQRVWTRTLNAVGVTFGVSNPALLHCEKLDASTVVHGDDFKNLGEDGALGEVEHVMSDHYAIKVLSILGAGCDDAKEVRILNRYVRWKSDGGKNCIVVMRAACLSHDRPDLSYSTKELTRDMQKPTEPSMTNLKRLGRYLKKHPRLVQLFVQQTLYDSTCMVTVTMRVVSKLARARQVWC